MTNENEIGSVPAIPGVGDLAAAGTCSLLRTKTMRLGTDFRKPVEIGPDWEPSSTAIFWCIKTMSTKGPDEGDVDPRDCRDHRACFGGKKIIDV